MTQLIKIFKKYKDLTTDDKIKKSLEDILFISEINKILENLNEFSNYVLKKRFLSEDKKWYEAYFSKSTYYRVLSKAISEFKEESKKTWPVV